MKPKLLLLIVLSIASSVALYAQQKSTDEQSNVQQVMRNAFESFSTGRIQDFELTATPDVTILERGEVWTLDTIRGFFRRPRPADFKRINTLDFFKTELHDRVAYVCYYNTAAIHSNGKDIIVKWLESGVLVKEGATWKLKMLHSTRLQPPEH